MDEIAVKVDLKDEILIDAEGLDSIVIYVNNYVKELETLTNSLTQHKESTDNPHAVNTTQEFADAKITALQPEITGGEIPDADYNAFKTFFAGLVDKSVKSFIRGLVSWVNSLAVRIGLLEDKYILKYVVPVDSVSVDLTQDKYGNPFNFVEGDNIEIIVKADNFVGNGGNRVNLRVNNIYNYYMLYNALKERIPLSSAAASFGHFTKFDFTIYNGELIGFVYCYLKSTAGSEWNANSSYIVISNGLGLTAITSLNFSMENTTYPLPAGTVILIKKI